MLSKVDSLLVVLCLCRAAWKVFLVVQQVASREYLGALLGAVEVVRLLWLCRHQMHSLGVELARRCNDALGMFRNRINRRLDKEDPKD